MNSTKEMKNRALEAAFEKLNGEGSCSTMNLKMGNTSFLHVEYMYDNDLYMIIIEDDHYVAAYDTKDPLRIEATDPTEVIRIALSHGPM
jgi:hypothetical protein